MFDYKVHFQFKYRFKNVKMQYDSVYTELSKSLSCLSDNRSGRCGQCVRPIKHLPDLHFFYNFNWITHILAKSIKWFVYSFKWYLGILKVSTTHFCVTCGNIHTIQYTCVWNKQRYQVCIMLAIAHVSRCYLLYKCK